MSSAQSAIEKVRPGRLPQPLTSILAALLAVGVAAFAYGLSSDPQVTWLAFHTNFIYFAALSNGALILLCAFVIVGAKWPGPLRHIAEGLAAWVPISFLLGCVGYFGGDYLFEWLREGAVHGKEPWLNAPRFYITDLGVLAALGLLAMVFLKTTSRPLLGGGAADSMTGFAKRMADGWTTNWRGDREEIEAAHAKLAKLSPVIVILFAMGFSVFIFDQVMSMEQTWYSNLFGAFVSWGGILSAVAAISLMSVLHRNSEAIGSGITEERLHDIGKMMFAFSIFWMYLFFSQYLVIWYGNLPEETQFFLDRLGPQFLNDKGFTPIEWALSWSDWNFSWERFDQNYAWLSMVVWACCWLIPFWVLLGEKPKKTPWILGPVAVVVLLGFWLERNLLIWPSVIKQVNTLYLGPIPILIALGFFGAFGLVFLFYTRVFPSFAVEEEN
ncbi:MAG: hypothetical protein VCC68_06730 [Myxococcota bacterium]